MPTCCSAQGVRSRCPGVPCQLYFSLDFCILQKPTRCSVQSVSWWPGVVLRQSGLNANVSRNLVFQPKTIKSVFEAVICLDRYRGHQIWIQMSFKGDHITRLWGLSPKNRSNRAGLYDQCHLSCGNSYKLNLTRVGYLINGSKLELVTFQR